MHFLSSSALVAVLAGVIAQAQTIITPTGVTFCQPTLLTWSGGMAPYTVTIIPGGQPNGAVIETLATMSTATSLTWIADIAAGTSITFALRDMTGNIVYSAPVNVAAGTGTTCGSATANSASINPSNTVVAGASGVSSAAAGVTSSAAAGASSAVTRASSAASSVAASATAGASSLASRASSIVGSATGAAASLASGASAAVASATARSGAVENVKVGGLFVAAAVLVVGAVAL